MEYHIRKSESYWVTAANEPVAVESEKFKNLKNNPCTANSAEEFLDYILNLRWDVEHGVFPEGLDFETQQNLKRLFTASDEEISSSVLEEE
jgi:hypothetical protein